jgi:hypothetical protein
MHLPVAVDISHCAVQLPQAILDAMKLKWLNVAGIKIQSKHELQIMYNLNILWPMIFLSCTRRYERKSFNVKTIVYNICTVLARLFRGWFRWN